MKKLAVLALLCAFALGACLPNITLPNASTSVPTIDAVGTANANALTANAQIFTAQASPTFTAVTTETSTVTPVIDFPTIAPINTDTPLPTLTTIVTATSVPVNSSTATSTSTLAPSSPGSLTASPTNGILTYGTLPPQNRPYTTITLINRAQREVYISLQVVTDQGYTIIEYPVKHVVKVKIPVGNYTYVAWVGGRQFVGYFHVSQDEEPTIKIFKDKIVIN